MSANAPRKQSSCTAHIMEVHPAPQVANEDDNPTMDCDPVAPAGGPPSDDGPGGDPGDDDPNDPFNNDEVEDQLNQLDPGLIVFSNLAGAINALACNAQGNSESSSSHTRVCEPDTFDGTDPKKLCAFLVQCELNFQDRRRAFNADRAKVTFAQSYLKGMALASAKHFVLDSSGQSHTDPQSPQLSPFWTGLSRHTFSVGSCPALASIILIAVSYYLSLPDYLNQPY